MSATNNVEYRPVGALCDQCGAPVAPNQPYSFREIVAWEMVSRTGGVGSRVRRKRYTGRLLCPACGRDEPQQESLF